MAALVVPSLVVAAWLLGPVPGGLRQLAEVLAAVPVEASRASEVADYLYQQQQLSRLIYETGRTR